MSYSRDGKTESLLAFFRESNMFGNLQTTGIGRVTEITRRKFNETEEVITVKLAIRQKKRDGETFEVNHQVTLFGAAQKGAEGLTEGDHVTFRGNPRVRLYEGTDGKMHYSFETVGYVDRLTEDSDVCL
jgi:hypothetical protein